MPKYEISIGSYFFLPPDYILNSSHNQAAILTAAQGGHAIQALTLSTVYRLPTVYTYTHMLTTPQYVLTPPTPPPVVASIIVAADLQMVNNQNSKINIKRAPLYACSYCTYLVM